MHELGLTREIIALASDAATQAGATRVTRVNLVIGDLASAVDSSVRFYFELLAEGTPCAGAELAIDRIPASLVCACGQRYPLAGRDWTCPKCGGQGRLTDDARQFYVASVEVEDSES